ncbi:MAG: YaiO family outer membrane beta-barrel protein [Chitinophagaceae bacterium]|nr:MAG: YaiO family outer membrane beta-barrel protein [Chitinophagaceae bacterium]
MKLHYKNIILLAMLTFLSFAVNAQKQNVDDLLKQALQETNVDKDYPKAINTANAALKLSPNYTDVHLLLGRLYLLTGDLEKARTQLKWVLAKEPQNQDALNYMVNVEAEAKDWDQALLYVDQSLQYNNSIEMQAKKEALIAGKQEAEDAAKRNRIGLSYNYTFFDESRFKAWNMGSIYYIRDEPLGSYLARVNYVDRGTSGANGYQFEIEAYPKHKNGYSFINAAYANNIVFPKFRFGYSYFADLKNGWEGELGVRYLNAADMDFQSFGGSIGKYFNSYWINFRPFVTNQGGKIYSANTLTARKYFSSRESYVTLILGTGTSPDDRGRDFQFGSRYRFKSYRASLGFQQLVGRSTIIGLMGTYNNQELTPTLKRNEYDVFINLQQKF